MKEITYEFLLPTRVRIVDQSEWSPLKVPSDKGNFLLLKPIPGESTARAIETISNEILEVSYSLMRVQVSCNDEEAIPDWQVPLWLVHRCIEWIRVATRQYWLGFKWNAVQSLHGCIQTTVGGEVTIQNFGTAGWPIFPPPLTQDVWKAIGREIIAGQNPPVSEQFLCDALARFHERAYRQAIVAMGIACELELNSFIDDLLCLHHPSTKLLYSQTRFDFRKKFSKIAVALGASEYPKPTSMETILALYELRGAVAHRGRCEVDNGQVSRFWFAVEEFFRWTAEERKRIGIKGRPSARADLSGVYTIG